MSDWTTLLLVDASLLAGASFALALWVVFTSRR
jgi:hypothetical protein